MHGAGIEIFKLFFPKTRNILEISVNLREFFFEGIGGWGNGVKRPRMHNLRPLQLKKFWVWTLHHVHRDILFRGISSESGNAPQHLAHFHLKKTTKNSSAEIK